MTTSFRTLGTIRKDTGTMGSGARLCAAQPVFCWSESCRRSQSWLLERNVRKPTVAEVTAAVVTVVVGFTAAAVVGSVVVAVLAVAASAVVVLAVAASAHRRWGACAASVRRRPGPA